MGSLGNTLPATIRPGYGGYTYPLPSVVKTVITTRVNPQLCTLAEAYEFLGLVLMQGDVIPAGQMPTIREETESQLYVDLAYKAAGYLPFVLEFAARAPGKGARDLPEMGSATVETGPWPYAYSINIGEMYASAPQAPGSTNSLGSQVFSTSDKIQVKADGSFSWAGLDQPTWQGDVTTAQ